MLQPNIQNNNEYVDFVGQLRSYLGAPTPASNTSRTEFRDEFVFNDISDMLKNEGQLITILDVCCGYAPLIPKLSNSLSEHTDNIAYIGIDREAKYIDWAKKNHQYLIEKFNKLEFRTRDATDIEGLELERGYDVILLANCLHEIPPRYYASLLSCLNSLLNSDRGHIFITDMEELPNDDPECNAIVWTHKQVESIAHSGGWKAVAFQPKKTQTTIFGMKLSYLPSPDIPSMNSKIYELLQKKLDNALSLRESLPVSGSVDLVYNFSAMRSWLVATGTIARLAEELRYIVNVPVPS